MGNGRKPWRFALLALVGLSTLLAAPPPAQAFDWTGKLRVTVARLSHHRQSERLAAVRALANFPVDQVQPHLLRATQDLDDKVRITAAQQLATRRAKAVIPVLTDWLSDFELTVRVEAARLLGELGDASAVGPLLRTFGDFEHKVRVSAVVALGKIGSRTAVTGIIGRLDDPNVHVKRQAISVLSTLVDSRAVIPLLGKLTDASRDIRQAAPRRLGPHRRSARRPRHFASAQGPGLSGPGRRHQRPGHLAQRHGDSGPDQPVRPVHGHRGAAG